MAINYQQIPINMQGLNQKADDKQLPLGEFTELKNVWMDKTKEFQKRFGKTKLYETLATQPEIADWFGKPVVFDQDGDIKYYNGTTKPTEFKTNTEAGSYSTIPFAGNLKVNTYIDYAESSDYGIGGRIVEVDVSGTPTNKLELSYYDAVSRKPFYSETIDSTIFKIVSRSDRVFVIYVSGTAIKIREYAGYNASGFPDYVATDLQASDAGMTVAMMDAIYNRDSNYVSVVTAYDSTASPNRLRYYAYDYTNNSVTTADISVGNKPSLVALGTNSSSVCDVAYFDDLTTHVCAHVTVTLPNTFATPTTVTTHVGETPDQISCISRSGTSFVALHRPASLAATGGNVLDIYKYSGSWAIDQQFGYAELGSRLFRYIGHGTSQIAFYISKPYESIDTTNVGLSKVLYDGVSLRWSACSEFLLPSKGRSSFSSLIPPPNVYYITDSYYVLSFIGTNVTDNTGQIVVRDYTNSSRPNFAYWQNGLLNTVTPNLRLYDGISNNYVGWPVYPSQPLDIITTGGAGYAAGTYGIRICYVRYDYEGNVSRSAPSPVYSETFGATSSALTAKFRPYPFYDEETDLDKCFIELYRTVANGAIYYLDGTTDLADLTYASGQYDELLLAFSETDANLISKPLLYTEGGIIEHIGPPAANAIAVSRERVWLLSAEDGRAWYSKSKVRGEMPNFSDAFVLDYEGISGLRAASTMDDKTVLFSADQIFVVFGIGPDETGAGNFDTQEITTDLGTSQSRSVIHTSNGVYFLAKKGFYMLGRDLSTKFVGDKVVDEKDATIVGAYEVPDKDLIYFVDSDSETHVYDEYHGIWSTFDSVATDFLCSNIVNSVPHYIGTISGDRMLIKEDSSTYQDDSNNYECKFVSGWLNFANIQGYKRIRKMEIVGETTTESTNTMNLKFYTDFDDTNVTETFAAVNSVVHPTAASRYQWGVKPRKQRMESLKFSIDFTTADSGFKISNLSFEAGVIGGIYRQKLTRRVEGS